MSGLAVARNVASDGPCGCVAWRLVDAATGLPVAWGLNRWVCLNKLYYARRERAGVNGRCAGGEWRLGAIARRLLEQPAHRFVAVDPFDGFAEERGDAQHPGIGGHLVGTLWD